MDLPAKNGSVNAFGVEPASFDSISTDPCGLSSSARVRRTEQGVPPRELCVPHARLGGLGRAFVAKHRAMHRGGAKGTLHLLLDQFKLLVALLECVNQQWVEVRTPVRVNAGAGGLVA